MWKVGDRVRCVAGNGSGLVTGDLYHVSSVACAPVPNRYYLTMAERPLSEGWLDNRFVLCIDMSTDTPKPISSTCPCGIHRSDCEYHR